VINVLELITSSLSPITKFSTAKWTNSSHKYKGKGGRGGEVERGEVTKSLERKRVREGERERKSEREKKKQRR
jgi:hypothetical protein